MQYALVNGIKSEAKKGAAGYCPGCNGEVIAKCGIFNINHWAHKIKSNCSKWSEPETEWHRKWKSKFPITNQEVFFKDENTGTFHRADIHTEGITIEFQNSPITLEELSSREDFYEKLIWVVNGMNFINNFSLEENIPDPTNDLLSEFDFVDSNRISFFRNNDCRVFGMASEPFNSIGISQSYFRFKWLNKRKVWYHSTKTIFFDFGDSYLYWFKKRNQESNPFFYIQLVLKQNFIDKYSKIKLSS